MDAEIGVSNAALPAWAQGLFASELVHVSDAAGRPTPVWAIPGDCSEGRVSEQFTANAGQYHARYAASAHFENLFRQALSGARIKVPESPLILDLGSGSGVNSVVPCFALFPGARQVATDLSGDLLAILADYAQHEGLAERVVCVVMDAMSSSIQHGAFDVVTGASILHHLVHPRQGLLAAANALKPGGHAIFTEPFDGYGVIRLAYERILAEAALRGVTLDPTVEASLKAMIADIAARTMPDRRALGFADMDDKWLFSREYFEEVGPLVGFANVKFVPHNDHEALYRDIALVQLRLFAGVDDLTLPYWAMDILDAHDRALRPPVKRLLMLEGSVVLTKGR
jgi:SAM-dependent methyltransferase